MNKVAKAVFTLTAFSMAERILGFFFKVYLSRELGATALGTYQVALSFFFVLMAVTTSGLPLVTGKLTAAYDVTGMKKNSSSLVSAGIIISTVVSVVLCGIILLMQGVLKNMMASGDSVYVLLIFLPALIFGSVGTAFRGSLWGREKYFAVSLIELVEQIVRVILCITLFFVGVGKLEAAAISLVIATFANALLCCVFYFICGGRLSSPRGQFKLLIKSSAPISGLKTASSFVNSIMSVVVPMLFVASGMSNDAALANYGAAVGMALPLMYLPVTVVGALAYTLVPSISKALARGDKKDVRKQVDSAVSFSIVIAAIFIPVFFALGEPLGNLVFKSAEAGHFLKLGGILLIPLSLESIVSSMMNSLGLELRGFFNSMIGSALMFGIMFCFYGNFTIDVLFWSLFASLVLSTVLDIICVKKKTGASLGFIKTILLSAAISYPCICLCRWTYSLLSLMPALAGLAGIAVAGVIGTSMFLLLASVFGLVNIKFIFSKTRKTKKAKYLRRAAHKTAADATSAD